MQTVWRYGLTSWDCMLQMPSGARIVHFDQRSGEPTIWVLVDPAQSLEYRYFKIVGTGTERDTTGWQYIGTVQFPYAWHLFEGV